MTDQTANFDADHIVPTSINADARVDETHAQDDDDQRWVETVLDSLSTRSRAAREALTKALLDGRDVVTSVSHVSGLELSTRKTAKKGLSKCDKTANHSALHVSGTTFFKVLSQGKSSASCQRT